MAGWWDGVTDGLTGEGLADAFWGEGVTEGEGSEGSGDLGS